MGSIDKIILSANEDPTYIEFWHPVAYAYKKMFPECEVHLAFLTNRSEDDPYLADLRKSGTVTIFKTIPDIPEFAQAKMIRFILASQMGQSVCYIDDIDLFPLVKSFIKDKTDQRPENKLLCVGGEVYGGNGAFPVSQMTGEGDLWKQFINPNNLEYEALMRWYCDLPIMFELHENPNIVTDWAADLYFSDERLIRKLRKLNPVPIYTLERGYKDFMTATIDRYRWEVDINKLDNHGYVNAHGVRPYIIHAEKYAPLLDYINANY